MNEGQLSTGEDATCNENLGHINLWREIQPGNPKTPFQSVFGQPARKDPQWHTGGIPNASKLADLKATDLKNAQKLPIWPFLCFW